ncbi:MAG: N-succinylarginine dihydrolase [Halobacteriovoraceae bacterium]|nr:N-succinylarginine dihydrolase [Halobacteriovoraceae bacterium]|tara:strand:+ start:36810 stop:38150 length:1341 start_codon:yes stop_codon:yes gene_type:complete
MSGYEFNFDGLVGPSHNYAGLSSGNVASTSNAGQISNPKAAAKQGLHKAYTLSQLGLKQGLIAPHCRPDFEALKRLGFSGDETTLLNKVSKQAPELLAACYSASAMWTANAATVSPSADTEDGKVHFTAANLNNKFHRSLEPEQTGRILKKIFRDETIFKHHTHLPAGGHFSDEGAANHTRFCSQYDQTGVEFFIFGRYAFQKDMPAPVKFDARQTKEASMAIARLHGLNPSKTVFAQQNPAVIDAGVFHNDVISVGNKNVYFFHEDTLLNKEETLKEISEKFGDHPFHFVEVPRDEVRVEDAVKSYLFNSQLLSINETDMAIVVPEECKNNENVWNYLQKLPSLGSPIKEVKVFNVTESMKNGGGPACLRLRVALKEEEIKGVNPRSILSEELYKDIDSWIDKHYRDQIHPDDLRDPALANEVRTALDELTQIMDLGSIYPFQMI